MIIIEMTYWMIKNDFDVQNECNIFDQSLVKSIISQFDSLKVNGITAVIYIY